MSKEAKRGARGKLRGHPIRYNGNDWRYEDTDEKTVGASVRPCGFCDAMATKEGHDACLGTIPDVANACCGHGESKTAYIVHGSDGERVSGLAAMAMFAALGVGPPASAENVIEALVGALNGITGGSTIRAYGLMYVSGSGKRRHSIVLTNTAREQLATALAFYTDWKQDNDRSEEAAP